MTDQTSPADRNTVLLEAADLAATQNGCPCNTGHTIAHLLRRMAAEAQPATPDRPQREQQLAAVLHEVLTRFRQADNDGVVPDGEVLAFVGPTVTPETYRRWCDASVPGAAAPAKEA